MQPDDLGAPRHALATRHEVSVENPPKEVENRSGRRGRNMMVLLHGTPSNGYNGLPCGSRSPQSTLKAYHCIAWSSQLILAKGRHEAAWLAKPWCSSAARKHTNRANESRRTAD